MKTPEERAGEILALHWPCHPCADGVPDLGGLIAQAIREAAHDAQTTLLCACLSALGYIESRFPDEPLLVVEQLRDAIAQAEPLKPKGA